MSYEDVLEGGQSSREDNDRHFTKLWDDIKKVLYLKYLKYLKLLFFVKLLHVKMKNN